MLKEDAELLVSQLRGILLSQSIDKNQLCETGELKELQGGIFYLSNCMEEFHAFMGKLCAGELNVETPSKENFLTGYVKELHAILKHLTWQASKVAEGDYQQRVTFLGEFSASFNKMIEQLEEREIHLRKKSEALSATTKLLQNVMDQQEQRIYVVNMETGDFVYSNQSAREKLYNPITKSTVCGAICPFIPDIVAQRGAEDYEAEYYCDISGKYLSVKGAALNWEDKQAYAYFISDITTAQMEKSILENMAYVDPLTSLFNRRYCLEELEKLLELETPFCLILLDLDYLKVVNDTYGHEIGDEYIKTVATLLSQESRAEDAVCRIGGDEFVIIWKGCNEPKAKEKMEYILSRLESQKEEYPMSMSYGIAFVEAGAGTRAEDVIKKADAKMYRMKKNRNRKRV